MFLPDWEPEHGEVRQQGDHRGNQERRAHVPGRQWALNLEDLKKQPGTHDLEDETF